MATIFGCNTGLLGGIVDSLVVARVCPLPDCLQRTLPQKKMKEGPQETVVVARSVIGRLAKEGQDGGKRLAWQLPKDYEGGVESSPIAADIPVS